MTPNLDLQISKLSPMTSLLIPALLLVSLCHTQQLQPQQAVDCTNPTTTISPSCWDTLGIPSWLSQFAGPDSVCANSSLTPIAEATSSWAACFILTINDGPEGQAVAEDLGLLNANTTVDTLYQEALEITPVEDRPRYFYVLTALSRIRGLFLDWNTAASSNPTAFGSEISAIIAALDPGNQTNFPSNDLYQALYLGLPYFLATNGTGIPLGLGIEDISSLLYELVQYSSIPPSTLSTPTNTTQTISATALSSFLPALTTALTSSIQALLLSTTTTLTLFLNLTTHGTSFTSPQPFTLPPSPSLISQPLTTYLLSSILAQTNRTVLALVGIDVAALSQAPATGGTLPGWVQTNCPTCTPPVDFGCTSYDGNGQCGRWWYSEDLNSSFTLVKSRDSNNNANSENNNDNDPTTLLSTILTQTSTTGSLLFENAAICDQPPSLTQALSMVPTTERPASPLKDYMDSWFWKLLGVQAVGDGSALVDIVVSEEFNAYIESRPGAVGHPGDRLVEVRGGEIDFSCMSQLGLRVGWDWRGIVAGDVS